MNISPTKKYIIDTDPGHDDAMAIMLALKSGMDVIALTTVAGNSNIKNTTKNAEYILDLLGRNDIPIYSGSDKPLNRELIQAVVHGESGLDGINPNTEWKLSNNAVEKILSILRNEENITIIALWPLTNLAKAILQDPVTCSKVDEIIIMWWAIRVPGNKNRVAEFNIFVDPEAADIVFRFPAKKTLIPLDACNDIRLQLTDFEKILWNLREPVLKMMKPYIENIWTNEWVYAALMYDPLTVYYILKPENCNTEILDIMIETEWILTRGMTVADQRIKPEDTNRITVVNKISPVEFIWDFIEILSR
jgi:inosine-uridine nucleoside N-ribohydrolase